MPYIISFTNILTSDDFTLKSQGFMKISLKYANAYIVATDLFQSIAFRFMHKGRVINYVRGDGIFLKNYILKMMSPPFWAKRKKAQKRSFWPKSGIFNDDPSPHIFHPPHIVNDTSLNYSIKMIYFKCAIVRVVSFYATCDSISSLKEKN